MFGADYLVMWGQSQIEPYAPPDLLVHKSTDYVSTFTLANARPQTAAAQVPWIVEMEETQVAALGRGLTRL